MRTRAALAVLCLTLLLSNAGCLTILDIYEGPPHLYGGARMDIGLIGEPEIHGNYFLPFLIIGILDLPLSGALDTVVLPLTIPLELSRSPEEKK